MFISFKDLIPGAAKKHKVWNEIQSSTTCFQLQKILNEICDHHHTKPKIKAIRQQKIIISCQNSSQMQELNMLKQKIWENIKKLNFEQKLSEISFTLD